MMGIAHSKMDDEIVLSQRSYQMQESVSSLLQQAEGAFLAQQLLAEQGRTAFSKINPCNWHDLGYEADVIFIVSAGY